MDDQALFVWLAENRAVVSVVPVVTGSYAWLTVTVGGDSVSAAVLWSGLREGLIEASRKLVGEQVETVAAWTEADLRSQLEGRDVVEGPLTRDLPQGRQWYAHCKVDVDAFAKAVQTRESAVRARRVLPLGSRGGSAGVR